MSILRLGRVDLVLLRSRRLASIIRFSSAVRDLLSKSMTDESELRLGRRCTGLRGGESSKRLGRLVGCLDLDGGGLRALRASSWERVGRCFSAAREDTWLSLSRRGGAGRSVGRFLTSWGSKGCLVENAGESSSVKDPYVYHTVTLALGLPSHKPLRGYPARPQPLSDTPERRMGEEGTVVVRAMMTGQGRRTKISSAVRDCVLGPPAAAASAGRGAGGWSRKGFLDRGRWDGIGSSKGEVGVVGKEETSMRPGEVAR